VRGESRWFNFLDVVRGIAAASSPTRERIGVLNCSLSSFFKHKLIAGPEDIPHQVYSHLAYGSTP